MVTVWFYDAPTTPQTTTAQNTVAAHDPAFFSTNKPQIANNGTDEATITLQLPHTNQASVVPLVNGIALPALTLVNQQATFVVSADESFDAGDTLTITVQTHPCEPLVIGVVNAR